jgi:hypothetical protein
VEDCHCDGAASAQGFENLVEIVTDVETLIRAVDVEVAYRWTGSDLSDGCDDRPCCQPDIDRGCSYVIDVDRLARSETHRYFLQLHLLSSLCPSFRPVYVFGSEQSSQ